MFIIFLYNFPKPVRCLKIEYLSHVKMQNYKKKHNVHSENISSHCGKFEKARKRQLGLQLVHADCSLKYRSSSLQIITGSLQGLIGKTLQSNFIGNACKKKLGNLYNLQREQKNSNQNYMQFTGFQVIHREFL